MGNEKIERIGVRTFLNPGWYREMYFDCTNCTAANRIAVRPLESRPHCQGLRGPIAAAILALRHERVPAPSSILGQLKFGSRGAIVPVPKDVICSPPKHGPCHGYIESAFSVGQWLGNDATTTVGSSKEKIGSKDSSNEVAKFLIHSDTRLAAKQRRHLFHHRSAICFYPDEASPQGWLAGYIEFHMDGPDVQAFVGFVCFFGIALPLICMVTVLLHVNKQQRCKQHVRELRFQLQREQLDFEISHRNAQPSRTDSLTSEGSGSHGVNSSAGQTVEAELLAGDDDHRSGRRLPPPRAQRSSAGRRQTVP